MTWDASDDLVHILESLRNGDFTIMATIITGDSSIHTDKAIEWLKANGATIEQHAALSIITLPETMTLDHDADYHRAWRYTVSLKADEDNGPYVEVCANADPHQIEFYLEK